MKLNDTYLVREAIINERLTVNDPEATTEGLQKFRRINYKHQLHKVTIPEYLQKKIDAFEENEKFLIHISEYNGARYFNVTWYDKAIIDYNSVNKSKSNSPINSDSDLTLKLNSKNKNIIKLIINVLCGYLGKFKKSALYFE